MNAAMVVRTGNWRIVLTWLKYGEKGTPFYISVIYG